jgi:hypothetical protein
VRDTAHPQPSHSAKAGLDPALPAWITPERIVATRSTWQPYYTETLTDEDAIEMLMTVGNLYRVLAGADDNESEEENPT